MRTYLFNLLLAIDQLGNALAAGYPDETISSRMGKWKLARMKAETWPPAWYHPVYWLERGLDWIDPNHVIESIERDEGEEAVVLRVSTPR